MNILYVHGLGSSGNSETAVKLENIFVQHKVFHPDIPLDPNEAILFIKDFVLTNNINVIIGTSLGSFYSKFVDGPFKILINPALPGDIMQFIPGKYKYYSKREDSIDTYFLDKNYYDKLNNLEAKFNYNNSEQSFIILGTNDSVCNNFEYFNHANYPIYFIEDMGHRVNDSGIDCIITLLKTIEDRINKRGYLIT